MKKKWIFFTIGLLCVGIYFAYIFFPLSDPIRIPIERVNAYQIPCTWIEIEGKRYPVEIDLGSKKALSLTQEVLETLSKEPSGICRRSDYQGRKYESKTYTIPRVKMGPLDRRKIVVQEESPEFMTNTILFPSSEPHYAGRVGRDFFLNQNLFLDFHHLIFLTCNQLKDIEKAGYETKHLISIPFHTQKGIVLEIETDWGPKNFVLDTGTSVTLLRPQSTPATKKIKGLWALKTLKFAMNGVDLGPRDICLLEISSDHNAIDGLLGMDFLMEHMIYLDFAKSVAYVGKSPH